MTAWYLCMTYCGPETRGVATAIRADNHDSHTHTAIPRVSLTYRTMYMYRNN